MNATEGELPRALTLLVARQGLNEVYLWHGTATNNIQLIVTGGFDIRVSNRWVRWPMRLQAPTRWCAAVLQAGTHVPMRVCAKGRLQHVMCCPGTATLWHRIVWIGRAMRGDLHGICVSGRQMHVPVHLPS